MGTQQSSSAKELESIISVAFGGIALGVVIALMVDPSAISSLCLGAITGAVMGAGLGHLINANKN
jgi:hypothetical protein